MDTRKTAREIDGLIVPVVESLGYRLIEVECTSERGRPILRLYIEKEDGGVTLGDCAKVSRSVSSILDVEDILPGRYSLEVSSPGEERPVRREEDFEKFKGFKAKIRTYEKIGDRKNFTGVLKGCSAGIVKMEDGDRIFKIPVAEIYQARLQGMVTSRR